MRATLAAVVVALAVAAPAVAAPPAKLQSALDAVVKAGVPGAIVLLRDGDRTTIATAGRANLATGAPYTAADRFRVGSVTKTFVATVILQLAGEGKLSLDDPVDRWLPGRI